MADQLIQLVKSLTGIEKRYVNLNLKAFTNEENSSKFYEDFNHLKKLSLLKSNKEFTISSNSTKLYYKILDILFRLHKTDLYDYENENRIVKRSQVLFLKGFYHEGIKQLNKVIYKVFNDNYLLKIEAIELKLKAAIKFVDVDYLKNNFEKDKLLLKEFSAFYFNLVEYESMWAVIKLEATTSYFYGKGNELNEYYNLLLSNEMDALSPNAKIYFNKINGFFAVKNNDFAAGLSYMTRARELYAAYHEIRRIKFSEYLNTIRNLCIVLIRIESLDKAEHLLSEIEIEINALPDRNKIAIANSVFTLMVLLRLNIIILNHSVKENINLIEAFEEKLLEEKSQIGDDEKATAYLYLTTVSIELGNYKIALKHVLNALLHSVKVRKDIHHLSLVSELVLYYLAGNSDMLFAKLNAYERFLKTNKVFFGFEVSLVPLLSELFNNPSKPSLFLKLNSYVDEQLAKSKQTVYKPYISLYRLKSK